MSADWVRDRIVAALKTGDTVEEQANAIMDLLEKTACERDTYHAFVGYLNMLRLDREGERFADAIERAFPEEDTESRDG